MPRVNNYYTNDMIDLFIQPDGPGTDVDLLPCVDVGDTSQELGEVVRERCASPTERGTWEVAVRSQGPEEEITFDLTLRVGKVANALESVILRHRCPLSFYKLYRQCSARGTFLPFDRADVLAGSIVTSHGDSNTVMQMNVDGAPTGATQPFSVTAEDWIKAFTLAEARRVTTEAAILNGIALYDESQCGGVCGPAAYPGRYGMIAADAIGAATANVLVTDDYGVTWAAGAAPPEIVVSINMVAAVVVNYGGNRRWIVARGTQAAVEAEVYWSEDDAATWNTVTVGTTVTEFAVKGTSLYAIDATHIWLVTDTGAGAAGSVFFSDDAGTTWTLQNTAADSLNAVHFVNASIGVAVGAANTIISTVDGGDIWAAEAGPAAMAAVVALSVAVIDEYHWLIGYADGSLYRTLDAGATWTAITLAQPTGVVTIDAINDIKVLSGQVVFLAYAWTAAVNTYAGVQRSIAGGEEATWEMWDAPVEDDATTGGLNLATVGPNFALAVGGLATTGMILEVSQT